MFFKKSEMQQDIDSFKTMQAGLSPASRTGRYVPPEASTNPSATIQRAPELGDKAIDSSVHGPTSGASDLPHSTVTCEATWEGKLRTESSARIEGTISGEIEAGDTVFIAKGAHVRANVHARRVIIAGELQGQITCREQLVVHRSGRLEGKVRTKTLVVEQGAVVKSQIQMLPGNEPKQAIASEPISGGDTIASPLGKTSSQRLKTAQAGSSEPKPIEL